MGSQDCSEEGYPIHLIKICFCPFFIRSPRLGPPRSARSNPEGKEGMENTLCAWRVGRGVNPQNRYCPTDRAFEVSSAFGHLSFGMMCLFGIVQWHRSRSPSFLDLCNTKVTYLCSPRSTPRRRHPLRRDMQWRQCRNPHQRTLYLPQRATNNRSKQSNVSCAKSTTAPRRACSCPVDQVCNSWRGGCTLRT